MQNGKMSLLEVTMKKRIHVYDCDGILLNSLHRYKTKGGKIDLDHWRENNTRENILKDKPSVLANHYKESLENPDIFVIIATARACEYNDANYEVINSKLGKPDLFVHREGAKDTRGGAALKIEGILPALMRKDLTEATIHVYEDNHNYLHDLCIAFRNFGFKTIGHFNPSYQGH